MYKFAIFFFLLNYNAMADSIDCFQTATSYERGLISLDAIKLCKKSSNKAAIYCFDQAAHLNLSLNEKIKLCSGAKSEYPIFCFKKGQTQLNLSLVDLIELCSEN